MSTPRLAGFSMPPEWEPHERTWMEFPPVNETFGEGGEEWLHHTRSVWAGVANAIVRFEPVTMICNVGDLDAARTLVDPRIELVEAPIDDAWFRDSGPTFLTHPDGRLGATHWRYNAWGNASFSRFDDEQHIGRFAAERAGAEVFAATMVNEGGGIHVDGEGTVIITETVQLDPERNPHWSHEQVETELKAHLGVEKVLWLPRGLTRDYDRFGTRGHVDILMSFVRPGLVVAHQQPNPEHPDHEVCRENLALLRSWTDARGRPLEVVEIDAPTVLREDGEWVDWSYMNHYVCNGAVILCTFDDPRDQAAIDTLAELYPDREIVPIDARTIFACGGGIHCITQQQPLPRRS
jgi:agmatine deiminase